jgi:virulence-associated protein VagC
MPRAVLKNGVIYPVDPLPPEWADGKELVIQPLEEVVDDWDALDRWLEEMNAQCADIDPEDIAKLQASIEEQKRESKAYMRREMGLPE